MNNRISAAIGVCTALVLPCVLHAQVVSQWDFNGDLLATTAHDALESVAIDGSPVVTFATESIGGEDAQVAQFADGTAFLMRHGAVANGGGAYVNNYTIIMDVRFDEAGSEWVSLYQTNGCTEADPSSNPLGCANDGDAFLNPSGGVGISGDYDGVVDPSWHRLAIAVDLTVPIMKLYVDGAFVNEVALGSGLDGRWSLYPSDDPSTPWAFILADDSGTGEMGTGAVNSLQFRSVAMSDGAIAALGGPSAAGIPLPAPVEVPALSILGAIALALSMLAGGSSLLRRARRAN